MKDQELICEPTAEALYDDDWKLSVAQSTLDEIELNYGSDPKLMSQVNMPERMKVRGH